MEDQEKRTEEELEDVEAHRRKHSAQASEEPADEAAGDDDVEAHRGRKVASASDEPRDETEGEDDFEAHRARKTQL
ncbi:MAG TPA: hypothetical protein VGJ25_00275 [Gaiellaceae bacterium]